MNGYFMSIENFDFYEDLVHKADFLNYKLGLADYELTEKGFSDNSMFLVDEVLDGLRVLSSDMSVFLDCLQQGIDINSSLPASDMDKAV